MKFKVLTTIVVVVTVGFILLSCSRKNEDSKTKLKIDFNTISKITVTTQMTEDKPHKIEVSDSEWKGIFDKLNSFNLLKKKDQEWKAGWEYLFVIEYKDTKKSPMQISVSDNEIIANDIVYEISNYNNQDFLYLFK